ncbi:hypothetical protein BCV70DRAFT_201750 [Testicularia cyperi]|uniref:Zn(2)-C6 fungal-type domain-containing protein n=1 Tax=Testicularia cyperi TaxID=1882483 RepID=A0A317XJE9_9BASI|nr:hypothetical protein BCV70DRAFT_201750 [Testicularia cyperi]
MAATTASASVEATPSTSVTTVGNAQLPALAPSKPVQTAPRLPKSNATLGMPRTDSDTSTNVRITSVAPATASRPPIKPRPSAASADTGDESIDQQQSKDRDKDKDAKDKDRETRLPACEGCRSRKIKCDALLPACTPCRKSGRECIGRDKAPNVSRGLIWELQQKVKDLEGRLASAQTPGPEDRDITAQPRRQRHSDENVSDGESSANGSGSPSSRRGRPPTKRQRRHGLSDDITRANYSNRMRDTADKFESASSPSSTSSSPSSPTLQPVEPSPNDLVQQTTSIFETLSSDLPASARRQQPPQLQRRSTQTIDDDEASALAALSKHHRDRTRSPERIKRRSSSNASRQRYALASSTNTRDGTDEQASQAARLAVEQSYQLSRPRSSRFTPISAYDRAFFDRLISRYLNYMNSALPVINSVRMKDMAARVYEHDRRMRNPSSSDTTPLMPPPPLPSSSGSSVDRLTMTKHRCLVLMALAIALASLGKSHHFSSELRRLGHQYWTEAQSLFHTSFRYPDLDKLRATLLQLQYAFLVPTAGSVWELSGAAIRLVTELNLHFDRDHDSLTQTQYDAETVDIRRRLFWTSYCLDRSLAVALARPPGLSDAWIHVQLPSLASDAELIRQSANHSGRDSTSNGNGSSAGSSTAPGNGTVPDPLKQSFQAHINLRRIQSEILCRLHSVNPRDYSLDNDGFSLSQPAPVRPSLAVVMEVGPPTPNVEWQSRMMDKLAEWKAAFDAVPPSNKFGSSVNNSSTAPTDSNVAGAAAGSTTTPFVTQDWIDLNYSLAASLLFRPSPNNPRPDRNGLQQAFIASGQAMKIYKKMHRNSTINFPWLATHHLFISGLTHLNSLEKMSRLGIPCPSPIVDVIFNVQSCASTLEALTSREDGYGNRIRDTFDAAASAVLRTVLEPNSRAQTSNSDTGTIEQNALSSNSVSTSNGTKHDSGSSAFDAIISGSISSPSSAAGSDSNRATATWSTQNTAVGGQDPSCRASHHEAMMQATQHPTWLSDSTWNSISSAPPPGSTILVAAPPRPLRFGAGGPPASAVGFSQSPGTKAMQDRSTYGQYSTSSFPPIHQASSRDSVQHNHVAGVSAMGSNSSMSGVNGNGSGGIGRARDTETSFDGSMNQAASGSAQHGVAGASGMLDMPSASTFGFHNWLLQPYEGGPDGMSFSPDATLGLLNSIAGFVSSGSSLPVAPMSSSSSSGFPSQAFSAQSQSQGQAQPRAPGISGSYQAMSASSSSNQDTHGANGAESANADATTPSRYLDSQFMTAGHASSSFAAAAGFYPSPSSSGADTGALLEFLAMLPPDQSPSASAAAPAPNLSSTPQDQHQQTTKSSHVQPPSAAHKSDPEPTNSSTSVPTNTASRFAPATRPKPTSSTTA